MTKEISVSALLSLVVWGACCCTGGTRGDSLEKDISEMFTIDSVAYPVQFANFQRNSHLSVATEAKGQLVWSKPYIEIDERLQVVPSGLHISGRTVGVRSNRDLLLYDLNGSFESTYPIGENTPVMFGKSAMAYIKPSYLMDYRDYDGNLLLESKDIPAAEKWTSFLVFKPTWDDLLAAVQFLGGPQRLPRRYDVYRLPIEKSRRTWSYDDEGDIDHALLSGDGNTMVLIMGTDVTVLNTVDGSHRSFSSEMTEIVSASLDLDGRLVVLGSISAGDKTDPCMRLFDLSGKQLSSYGLTRLRADQPPACGSDGKVYMVDAKDLTCYANGEPLWQQELEGNGEVWLTVASNDYVVCLDGRQLRLFEDGGNERFNTEITDSDETFDCPAAIDQAGRLYIAGSRNLYCFE
ncbi:MAG: hypothetical protein ACE5FH_02455 [Candidatus Zixiibacteriota bacterium]